MGKPAPPPPDATAEAAVWVAPSELRPWGKNPRRNDGEPVQKVMESIERFGFGAPIVARSNGAIIAGHTRWKAAQKLGLARVPVRYLDISERDAELLALADNRLGEVADWDDAALADLLQGFEPDEQTLAGWDAGDIKQLLQDVQGKTPPDEFAEVGDDLHTEHTCPRCNYKWSGGA